MVLGNFVQGFPNLFLMPPSLPPLPVPTVAAMGSPVIFDAKN